MFRNAQKNTVEITQPCFEHFEITEQFQTSAPQVNVAYPGVPPANPLTPGGGPLPYPLTVVGAPPLPPTQSGAPTYPHPQVQTRAPPPNAQFGAPRLPIIHQDTSRNQTEQVQPSAPEVIHYPESGSSDPSPTLGT